jgi:hypothetical protein
MCFCPPNLTSMFTKYADLHPEDVLAGETLWEWVARQTIPTTADQVMMVMLARLQLSHELPQVNVNRGRGT